MRTVLITTAALLVMCLVNNDGLYRPGKRG